MKKFFVLAFFLNYKFSFCKSFEKNKISISSQVFLETFDPVKTLDFHDCCEIYKVYEGLVEYDLNGNIINNLCEKIEVSKDNLTYTFRLKKGIFYHKNKCFKNSQTRQIKAQDFKYSILRVMDQENRSPLINLISNKIKGLDKWSENKKLNLASYDDEIEGIKIIDDHTIVFSLNKVWPQFLEILTLHICIAIPKEAVEFYGNDFSYNPVGTGPFILDKLDKDTKKIFYIKNDSYHNKNLNLLDKIEVIFVPEDSVNIMMLKSKKIDLCSVNINILNQIKEDTELLKDFDLNFYDSSTVKFFVFNTNKKPFDCKYFRASVSSCFDKKTQNEIFFYKNMKIADSIISPFLRKNKNYDFRLYDFDIENSKKFLKKSKYYDNIKNLEPIILDLPENFDLNQAEFFIKCMEKIGLKFKINKMPNSLYIKKIIDGESQIYSMGWIAAYPDADNFFFQFFSEGVGNPYFGFYKNKSYNDLYKESTKIIDKKKRNKIYEKMEKFIFEECPTLNLFYIPSIFLINKNYDFVYSENIKCTYFKYISKK